MRHNAERIQNIQKPRINRSLHVTINNHLKLGCAVLAHINTTTELECIKMCGSEKALKKEVKYTQRLLHQNLVKNCVG